MLNWLKFRSARRAMGESCREAVAAGPPRASPRLIAAIRDTVAALEPQLSRGALQRHRGQVIVILARQLADANERLSSNHWTGANGHNVGRDVLQAHGVALTVVRKARSMDELLESLADASADYRGQAGDPDGYGSATLGEIERDLKALTASTASNRG